MLEQAHVLAAPFHPHQVSASLQQIGGVLAPGVVVAAVHIQRQQVLEIASQRRANIAYGVGRVALQLFLYLRCLIAPSQPDHGNQHADHQGHQQGPQRPALPGHAPTPPGPVGKRIFSRLIKSGIQRFSHSTRWVKAGNCCRTCCSRLRWSSPQTTPVPLACKACTSPQGSISKLCPQVRRPFSCRPPCPGAST